MPQATARPLAVALTDTPLPTPATQASSPQPSSTFRPTLGPSPTALVTPRPTPDTPRSTSRPTPSPIIVIPKLTRSPTASPIAVTLTSTPLAPRSTPSASLIPATAPRLYETTVTLTTYGYQQALEPSSKDDPIYPYPHLNPAKVGPPAPKNYRAIVLENSYTQVTILPELGGRIWRIVDKTTGRTVTYQNPVVKPTQWGYRGWWLATGGIEWCLPVEEHGLNEYRPWNAKVSGASVTVSDHEDCTGLDVAVTISLDAAHSTVTIQPRVTNSTGGPQKIQFWVNAMLALNGNHVADSTRFILPSAQVTVHSPKPGRIPRGLPRSAFPKGFDTARLAARVVHSTGDGGVPDPGSKLSWPVFKGRDLSQYANWGGHLGFFASPAASGEFAGAYDTSSDEGIVRVFPPGIARGVKFFGGKGINPATWTDDGSTYFELWGGLLPTFVDNATIQPGQTFGWTERWYPVSGLGQGFDTANATAALRLSIQSDNVSVGAVTSVNLNGQVKLWQGGQVVATWPVAVGPGRAFSAESSAGGGQSLVVGVQLLDSAGHLIAQAGSVP
jgi:Domain of unknown function (DUF5107)